MITSHRCSWTRRLQSELTTSKSGLAGAGLPREALEYAATSLGVQLQARQSDTDEYGEEITLGSVARGATHDGCFFVLSPASASLGHAVLGAVLDLHATYLGATIDWSGILERLRGQLTPDTTIHFRSRPNQGRLVLRAYPKGTSFLRRAMSRSIEITYVDGRAAIV
jgi:hypothetical protein